MGKIWQKCWNALNYIYGACQCKSSNRLRSLKEIHTGRCFIIGNGPSLTDSDLQRLMQLGEVTFACNSLIKLFDEKQFRPTYYFAQDNKVILDNKEEIRRYAFHKGTLCKPLSPERCHILQYALSPIPHRLLKRHITSGIQWPDRNLLHDTVCGIYGLQGDISDRC